MATYNTNDNDYHNLKKCDKDGKLQQKKTKMVETNNNNNNKNNNNNNIK